MKTPAELMSKIDSIAMHNGNGYNNDILKEILQFESDIRAEKQETRIKELTSMGEFKTFGEAREYCKLHGLSDSHTGNNAFQIAGALMDARKDQDNTIQDLSMIVRMMVVKVRKTNPDAKVLKAAVDYLKKNGLEGSILRDEKGS